MARLIIEHRKEVLRDFPLPKGSITIGRQRDNTIVLSNPEVSGYHARIDKKGTDYILTDLQSTNGTFINNENVLSRRLLHGDRIRIGEHVFLFVGTEKAEIEAEKGETPLNRTVILGAGQTARKARPGRKLEVEEVYTRAARDSGPVRRWIPLFSLMVVLVAGGWFFATYGSLLLERLFPHSAWNDMPPVPSMPSRDDPGISQPAPFGPAPRQEPGAERGASSAGEEEPGTSLPGGAGLPVAPAEEAAPEPWESREPLQSAARKGPRVADEGGFRLDGIVWSSDEKHSFAVINGLIFRVGGRIEGMKVAQIGNNYVLLRSPEDGSELKLILR